MLLGVFLSQLPALGQAQQRQVLRGHVPAVVVNLRPVGRMPSTNQLRLAIGLPLRDQAALNDLIRQLYDPASAQFHRYLTPEQFTEAFGPSVQDYQSVIAFAKASGFTVIGTHPNRMLLDVSGSVGDVEKAFHVTLRTYRHPRENRTFFTPDVEPSVEVGIPILSVSGLSDYIRPHPVNLRQSEPVSFGFYGTGSGPNGSYWAYDFRHAYATGVPLDGSGQMVGLFELDGYYTNDIGNYEEFAGVPVVPLENVFIDGFSGPPGDGNQEVALDIEMAIAMAPGLAKVIVYQGPTVNNISVPNDVLNRMATDGRAKQLSCSWGFYIDGTTEQIFQEFAAQGQSLFQAAGDSGAYAGPATPPTDDPYLTSVGGAVLTTVEPGGSWVSESVWPSGGGGSSFSYAIPSWQQGIDMTTNQGSTTMRNFPDVAMLAQNVVIFAWNGGGYIVSGTSASAPLWAGFTALVNQQAAINAGPPVGFVNPALYAIGTGSNYASCLHDITVGNNTNTSSPTKYFAVPGYDLCTGWGTPNGSNLINALAPFNAFRITPVSGLVSSGQIGGPFSPTAQTFSLTNAGTASVSWTLVNTSVWLNVSPAGGVLPPGTVAGVTVSPNYAANYLTAGSYPVNLWFTNLSNGSVQMRQFSLAVQPLIQNGGFETGDFSSWTLSGTNTSAVAYTNSNFPEAVHSGAWGAGLINVGLPLGYLSQTLPTVAGQTYLLSCWLDSSADPNAPHKTSPNEFLVSWNGTIFFNQTNIPVIGWTNLQFVVSAPSTNSILQFGFRDDPWALGLDDVTVQPIVTPSFQSVMKTNGAINFICDAVAGLRYQVQDTTNLTRPNWVNLGNPLTVTNWSFSTSDAVGSNSQRFYRIILSR